MFFDLVKKNSKKNRKENGIFFVSLIVSIIAFYIILSLKNQDVILFLKTMESDAVNKLLLITPVLYGFSLFILFFLVYFAGKYQLERRSHELGMYLMLGMRRSKLLSMLLLEEIWNSIISVLIGIPIAVFISEMISMITARVVGLGVIGHKFSFSIEAVGLTILGYFIIRLIALLILSGRIAKKDITELLSTSQREKHKIHNKVFTLIKLVLGVGILVTAYYLAIEGFAWEHPRNMGITIILGVIGTFLLFNSIGIVFEIILKNRKNRNGLSVFTFRQLQENVFLKSNSLAISSLLLLLALCCFGYGVSVSFNSSSKNPHVLDYTFLGDGEEIKQELNKEPLNGYLNEAWDVKLGMIKDAEDFSAKNLLEVVEKQKDSKGKDVLLNNLQCFEYPHIISLSGYNKVLEAAGKEPIKLNENQVALFNGLDGMIDKTGLKYESYLQNMGRELFYKVAASYTTIYLALIFLIIANTVIGVQFLMQQQKTSRRYQTLIRIGGTYKELCKSARAQIKWYFSFPIVIAAIGSGFGIRALFTGVSTSAMKSQITSLMMIALPTIIILCLVEFAYITFVMRISDKQISKLMDTKREDN